MFTESKILEFFCFYLSNVSFVSFIPPTPFLFLEGKATAAKIFSVSRGYQSVSWRRYNTVNFLNSLQYVGKSTQKSNYSTKIQFNYTLKKIRSTFATSVFIYGRKGNSKKNLGKKYVFMIFLWCFSVPFIVIFPQSRGFDW